MGGCKPAGVLRTNPGPQRAESAVDNRAISSASTSCIYTAVSKSNHWEQLQACRRLLSEQDLSGALTCPLHLMRQSDAVLS